MKLKKTVPVIVLSLILVLAAAIVVLWSMPGLTDGSYLDVILEHLLPTEGNVSVSVDRIDRSFLRSINLYDVDVYVYDELAVHSDSIKIKMGIFDLFRLVIAKTVKNVNAMVIDTDVTVNDTVMRLFAKSTTEETNPQTPTTQAANQEETVQDSKLKRMSFTLDIRNLSVNVNTSEIKATVSDSDAYVRMKGTMDITFTSPMIKAEYKSKDSIMSVKDLQLYAVDVLDNADVKAVISDLDGTFGKYSADGSFVRLTLLYSENQDSNVTVAADKLNVDANVFKAVSDNVYAYANIASFDSLWGGFEGERVDVKDFGIEYTDVATVENLKTHFSYNNGAAELRVEQSKVSSETNVDWIEKVSFDLVAEAGVESIENIDLKTVNLTASMDNLKCKALPYATSVGLIYRDETVQATVRTDGLYLNSTYNINSSDTAVGIDIDSMKPFDYSVLFEKFVPQALKIVDAETELSANISVSGKLDLEKPEAYVGLNIAVRDLKLSKDLAFNGALSLDADLMDKKVYVHSLALTAMDYRVTFSGQFDLDTYFPQGQLLVTNALDGSRVADFNFSLADDAGYYTYDGRFAFMASSYFSGQLRWKGESIVTAESVFVTPYQEFPLTITLNTQTLNADVVGPHVEGYLKLTDQGRFETEGKINNAKFHLSDSMVFDGSLDFGGYFDLGSGLYRLDLKDAMIDISDIAYVGFDIALLNNRVEVTEFILGRFANRAEFEGFGYLDYGSIADLISFNTAAFSGSVNLGQKGREGGIRAALSNNNYSLDADIFLTTDLKIGMLGQRGYGFYADCGIGDLSFKAEYRHPYIQIFNPEGNLFGLRLDQFNIVYNLDKAVLDGLVGVSLQPNKYETSMAGAEIEFSITYDSIRNIALSYAGLEESSTASVKLRNLHLGEYVSEDEFNQVLILDNNSVRIEGDVINGNYSLENGNLELSVSDSLPVSFNLEGKTGKNLDMMIRNLNIELPVLGQLLSIPFLHFLDGSFTGDLLVKGPASDPSFYGMLYTPRIEIDLFYLPDQTLIANGIAISVNDHEASFAPTPTYGYSTKEGSFFNGRLTITAQLQNLGLSELVIDIDDIEKPIDFWYPLITKNFDMNITSNVTGHIILSIVGGQLGLGGDIVAENLDITLKIPDNLPEWYYETSVAMNLDLDITAGKDCEFFYPEKDNSFMNFTVNEGEKVHLDLDNDGDGFTITGSLSVKTGRIYYFQNDFFVTDGAVKFTKAVADPEKTFNMTIDMTARLREYDSNGKQTDIYLILQNSTLDNLVPRFESSPAMSQAEIMQFLGQSFIQSPENGVSLYSLASIATATADAFTTLGLLNQDSNYSLSKGMREALGLDMFSLRSSVIQNLVLSYLPGMGQNDYNMVSRYLDGTSIFAGKYFNSGLFGRASVSLNAGKTVKFDIELSVNWDNEIGSFSIFTSPGELSLFNFLDNIGFSFSRRILL